MISISKHSEELLHSVDIMKRELIGSGKIKRKCCNSYLEAGDITVRDFDYYGYSSVAPIIPPLDLTCLSEDDDTDGETFDTVSSSESYISVFSWLSSERNFKVKRRETKGTSDTSESLSPTAVTERKISVVGSIARGFRNLKSRFSSCWRRRSNKVDCL